MRKKSHVSLGIYLVDSMDSRELKQHRKAFLLGSVLPDCKPSFLTRRHEMSETYEALKETMEELTGDWGLMLDSQQIYWRRMGEVLHYVADYFTHPHNAIFEGTLRDHCRYENILKHYLKFYIFSGRAKSSRGKKIEFSSMREIFQYMEKEHGKYLISQHSVENDAEYITRVCLQVLQGMHRMTLLNMEEAREGMARAA